MKRSTRFYLIAAFVMAPWSRIALPYGGRLSDVMLLAAAASIWLFTPPPTRIDREPGVLYLPPLARRHFLGLALIASGICAGSLWTELSTVALREVVLNALLAALPLILLLRLRADAKLLSTLATALVAGVVLSVLAAPALGYVAQRGRWQGITGHMNQLGMTIALALPIISMALPGRRMRAVLVPGAAAVLLIGLERSGSRSGAVGAALVLVWLAVNWHRRNPGSLLRPKVGLVLLATVVCTALALPSFLAPIDPESDSLRSRVFQGGTAEKSDEKREELLEGGLEGALSPGALIGTGYSTTDQSPHNAFLELWLAGGLVAIAGAVLVFGGPLRAVWSSFAGPDRLLPVPPSARYAMGALAWAVAISLNNLFWARFGWMTLALFVASRVNELAAASDRGRAPEAGGSSSDGARTGSPLSPGALALRHPR